MAFAHLGRKLAVDSLTLGLAYSLDRARRCPDGRGKRTHPEPPPSTTPVFMRPAGTGTGPAHAPGPACRLAQWGCLHTFEGAPMAKPAGGLSRPGPDHDRRRTVSGDSRAERLKFQSQAKFFNPFNQVNFRSARCRWRPLAKPRRDSEQPGSPEACRRARDRTSASFGGNRGARMVRPVKLRLKTAPNLI